MRPDLLKELITKAHDGRIEPRALGSDFLFVARLKCSNLRCGNVTFGYRKIEEWIDWRAQKCAACGKRLILVRGAEHYSEVEVNAPAKVLRWRKVDVKTHEPLSKWEYAPFEFDPTAAEEAARNPGSAG